MRLGDGKALSRLQAEFDEASAEADHWRTVAHTEEMARVRAEERADAAERVAKAKVETAQADTRALRNQLDRELARVARLEDELRELRRPFWRRWLT